MTPTMMSDRRAVMLGIERDDARGSSARQVIAALGLVATGIVAACSQSNVPYLTAPTSVPNSPVGIQNAVTGLLSSSRLDVYAYVIEMTTFARDAAIVWGDNPQDVTWYAGLVPIPPADAGVWDREYLNVGQALSILQTVPNASPAYTSAQQAALTGLVQTIEALNLMRVAETRDTLGIPIHTGSGGAPGPVYCEPDVWKYIVALLDSANVSLNTAGNISLPVALPPGFTSVDVQAGPSTVAGSFAAFNRALAGKAGFELAYAIARNGGGGSRPTPTTTGAPDVGALTRADSAILASALYAPADLAPPTGGQFSDNSSGVFWDFSAQSGDQANPVHANSLGIWDVLKTLVGDVDTLNDLRWKGKFGANPLPLQLPQYNYVATEDVYAYYPATNSPIPIIRDEGLVLLHAQIRLGLGDLAGAITAINQVHQQVGGYATPLTIAATYTAVRDSLLKEQRISMVAETSGDRTISLRIYGLQAAADTTWGSKDLHTTVLPIPSTEIAGRNGTYTVTCP
jgi:hypothetical protein